MRKLLSTVRKTNLLFALELLDEAVRDSPFAPAYVGSTTEAAVTEAIARARTRREKPGIRPRHDQFALYAIAS